MDKIKALIIEDSKLMQEILKKVLLSAEDIDVVGIASDPLIARELIKNKNPDVLTLDIMLPHMDGITFLKNLMRLHPLPVVMVSTLTEKGSAIALEALAIGAVDYVLKPTQNMKNISEFSAELINAVRSAAHANVKKYNVPISLGNEWQKIIYESNFLKNELVAVGASTGGIEAIETILLQLPRIFPPIIIVQHIKKEFSSAFSKRIRKLYGLPIIEPDNQTELLPGSIYIAPGGVHLLVKKINHKYVAELDHSPPLKNHRPSIDILFRSVAVAAKNHSIGILLTGMGSDGALGLKEIRAAGGITVAQDKESSVIWGMPGMAVKMDAVDYVVSLNNIPQKLLQILDSKMLGTKLP